jgi:hypothetical protein
MSLHGKAVNSNTIPISVVIPTWNGRDILRDCLQSITDQTVTPAEVIVVDDVSTDGTGDMARDTFPNITVHRLEQNQRFCGAANAGIRLATQDYVLLVNNDMTLAPDCLERWFAFTQESGADVTGPLVLWKDEPDMIYTAGDRQRANGRPESWGYREALVSFSMPETVFGISMCAVLYSRAVIERIGLVDEHYVDYFSDSDYSFRARLAGFDVQLAPDARAYHVGSASLFGQNWWRSRQCYRNQAYLVLKNMPLSLLLRKAPAILAERFHQAGRVLSSARCEFGLVKAVGILFVAWLGCWAQIPRALRERYATQSTRTVSANALTKLLSP